MVYRVIAAAALAGTLAGCAPTYQDGRAEGSAITARRVWRASGDMQAPALAVDENPNTSAVSPDRGGRGTLTVDLGKPCLFNTVIIEHADEMGFAPRVGIWTSLDGQTFTQRCIGVGTRRVTILYLGTATLARYVRVEALAAGQRPWSVAEIYLN